MKIEGGIEFSLIDTKFKMAEKLSTQDMTSPLIVDSAQPKDSNDMPFLKTGHTVQKLQPEMYLQL